MTVDAGRFHNDTQERPDEEDADRRRGYPRCSPRFGAKPADHHAESTGWKRERVDYEHDEQSAKGGWNREADGPSWIHSGWRIACSTDRAPHRRQRNSDGTSDCAGLKVGQRNGHSLTLQVCS